MQGSTLSSLSNMQVTFEETEEKLIPDLTNKMQGSTLISEYYRNRVGDDCGNIILDYLCYNPNQQTIFRASLNVIKMLRVARKIIVEFDNDVLTFYDGQRMQLIKKRGLRGLISISAFIEKYPSLKVKEVMLTFD